MTTRAIARRHEPKARAGKEPARHFRPVCQSRRLHLKLDQRATRAVSSTDTIIRLFSILLVLLILAGVARERTAGAQQQGNDSASKGVLSTQQVVERLVAMNLRRATALHAYQGTRIYRLEYRGFPSSRSAEMVVDVKFRAPGTKEFTIRSSTGSKLILEKVFTKLLQAEEEAVSAEAQGHTALNTENYEFTTAGYETAPSGSMYVLRVEPKTKDKFLYRGRIWVDARDFAVVRMQGEPAKSPSFWTKSSEIGQMYTKVSDFWLPERNHSVSSIRLGGRAELTIEYQNYRITASDPVAPALEVARWGNAGAQLPSNH